MDHVCFLLMVLQRTGPEGPPVVVIDEYGQWLIDHGYMVLNPHGQCLLTPKTRQLYHALKNKAKEFHEIYGE